MTNPTHAYAAEQGIRRYHVEGLFPHPISVTSLIKVISAPAGLTRWVDKRLINAAIASFAQTGDAETAVQVGLGSRWAASEEADLGTAVHYLCEVSDLKSLGREVVPHPVADQKKAMTYVKQWEKSREEHEMIVLATEVTLVNQEVGYAGTADRIAIIPALSPLPLVLDIKSGKKIYPDVALQCAALSRCTQLLHDDGSLTDIPWELDQTNGIAAHVRPRSCRFIPLDIATAWPYFAPLAKLALWKTETVPVLGEALEPDPILSQRARLRLRMKMLPTDLAATLRLLIKGSTAGTTETWTPDQLDQVSDLFEPFEAEARERKLKVLDRWGDRGMMELRVQILGITGGRTSMLDDLVAAEIDALIGEMNNDDDRPVPEG